VRSLTSALASLRLYYAKPVKIVFGDVKTGEPIGELVRDENDEWLLRTIETEFKSPGEAVGKD
jgi:hypothetical protein